MSEETGAALSPHDSGDEQQGEMTLNNDSDDDVNQTLDQPPNENNKATSKAKDASRPKRKKARRACAACQRAHLTCGLFNSPQ